MPQSIAALRLTFLLRSFAVAQPVGYSEASETITVEILDRFPIMFEVIKQILQDANIPFTEERGSMKLTIPQATIPTHIVLPNDDPPLNIPLNGTSDNDVKAVKNLYNKRYGYATGAKKVDVTPIPAEHLVSKPITTDEQNLIDRLIAIKPLLEHLYNPSHSFLAWLPTSGYENDLKIFLNVLKGLKLPDPAFGAELFAPSATEDLIDAFRSIDTNPMHLLTILRNNSGLFTIFSQEMPRLEKIHADFTKKSTTRLSPIIEDEPADLTPEKKLEAIGQQFAGSRFEHGILEFDHLTNLPLERRALRSTLRRAGFLVTDQGPLRATTNSDRSPLNAIGNVDSFMQAYQIERQELAAEKNQIAALLNSSPSLNELVNIIYEEQQGLFVIKAKNPHDHEILQKIDAIFSGLDFKEMRGEGTHLILQIYNTGRAWLTEQETAIKNQLNAITSPRAAANPPNPPNPIAVAALGASSNRLTHAAPNIVNPPKQVAVVTGTSLQSLKSVLTDDAKLTALNAHLTRTLKKPEAHQLTEIEIELAFEKRGSPDTTIKAKSDVNGVGYYANATALNDDETMRSMCYAAVMTANPGANLSFSLREPKKTQFEAYLKEAIRELEKKEPERARSLLVASQPVLPAVPLNPNRI